MKDNNREDFPEESIEKEFVKRILREYISEFYEMKKEVEMIYERKKDLPWQ